jgi:hypothetical protein
MFRFGKIQNRFQFLDTAGISCACALLCDVIFDSADSRVVCCNQGKNLPEETILAKKQHCLQTLDLKLPSWTDGNSLVVVADSLRGFDRAVDRSVFVKQ